MNEIVAVVMFVHGLVHFMGVFPELRVMGVFGLRREELLKQSPWRSRLLSRWLDERARRVAGRLLYGL